MAANVSNKITKGNVQVSPEELRLLYIGTTRAKSVLNVHHLQLLIGTLRDLWPKLQPALQLLQRLEQAGLGTDYQVTSVYRYPSAK